MDVVENLFSVDSLRKNGYKVRVTHSRAYNEYLPRGEKKIVIVPNHDAKAYLQAALPRGGETVVELTTPTGQNFVGVSVCSKKDAFCRRSGTRVALARIYESMLLANQK